MSRLHSFLVLLLSCSALLLTGALGYEINSTTPSFVPQTAPSPAGPLLGQVSARLGSDKIQWLQMTVWQKLYDAEAGVEAEGLCFLAPAHRLRLEMAFPVGPKTASLSMVCDGTTLLPSSSTSRTAWALI